jgi:hypothetical protein
MIPQGVEKALFYNSRFGVKNGMIGLKLHVPVDLFFETQWVDLARSRCSHGRLYTRGGWKNE